MDTPLLNGLATVDLSCSCGASLRHTDFAHRTSEAEEEFRRVHVGELCGVGPYRDPLDIILASWDRLANDLRTHHGLALAVCAEQVRQATGRAKP